MTFWRIKGRDESALGSASKSGPNSFVQIDPVNDSPDVIERKLEIAARLHNMDRQNKRFSDRRSVFKMVFNATFFITLISAAWSLYVLLTASQQSSTSIAVAQFVISTVVSAALASGIALLATQPDA